jgi:hypothetical protein
MNLLNINVFSERKCLNSGHFKLARMLCYFFHKSVMQKTAVIYGVQNTSSDRSRVLSYHSYKARTLHKNVSVNEFERWLN